MELDSKTGRIAELESQVSTRQNRVHVLEQELESMRDQREQLLNQLIERDQEVERLEKQVCWHCVCIYIHQW